MAIIKRGYVPRITYKRKGKKVPRKKNLTCPQKRYPERRWLWERGQIHDGKMDSGNDTRYGKKAENYLGLEQVQLSCCIVIYKNILWDRL